MSLMVAHQTRLPMLTRNIKQDKYLKEWYVYKHKMLKRVTRWFPPY